MDEASQLKAFSAHVDELEERHNEVVDVHADINERIADLRGEIAAEAASLHEEAARLSELLEEREERVKHASVLISLLAQPEELSPLKRRVEAQPYERYAESAWFADKTRKHR